MNFKTNKNGIKMGLVPNAFDEKFFEGDTVRVRLSNSEAKLLVGLPQYSSAFSGRFIGGGIVKSVSDCDIKIAFHTAEISIDNTRFKDVKFDYDY
ncbi:MAG TPA: hypothetical protein DCQ93_03975 [Bacteroidetes bacterium]|nr:hypothetical protein [Bacteroidota bacterium]